MFILLKDLVIYLYSPLYPKQHSTRKWMVGIRLFPFEARHIFRGKLLVYRSVIHYINPKQPVFIFIAHGFGGERAFAATGLSFGFGHAQPKKIYTTNRLATTPARHGHGVSRGWTFYKNRKVVSMVVSGSPKRW